ncbi:MAG: ABC transporter permease [Verrucomicrobia bacterium]|nr:ABC transporter permease [Verrucomicrobiota bacterium]MBV8485823.1 ABC transporter permease [Verrucomicrobiota bacterium]
MSLLRHTIRLLLKSPGFAITAILILGFGIGTNTAIFSLVQAVIVKPLPYPDPTSLIQIFLTYQGNEDSIDYPDYLDILVAQRSFKNMAAVASGSLDLTGEGNPERLKVDFITASMFAVTGSSFVLGRPFTENEDVPGGPLLVVLSEQFWRTRFDADPSIIGKNLMLSDHTFQVIGVVPRQINWWSPCDIYVPINTFELFYPGDLRKRTEHIVACFGRLNTGVSLTQAKAELDTIHERLIARYPDTDKGYGLSVVTPGRGDYTVYDYSPAIWLLAAGVSCLLLISCANIANLLLARSLQRRKEISVRAMLGGERWLLAGQLLFETMFLATLGAGLGLLVALIAIEVIKKLSWQSLYRIQYRLQEVSLDINALIFIVFVSLVVALLAGVLPALRLSKSDVSGALKDDTSRTGTTGKQRHRAQAMLVIGQVALTCVLLVSASLLARTFQAAQNLPLGFDSKNTLTVELVLKAKKYLTDDALTNLFWKTVLAKARQLPGVNAAALNDFPPFYFGDLDWGAATPFTVVGQPDLGPGHEPKLDLHTVSAGYFQSLRIPLLLGRDFNAQDDPGHEKVVIIDEALAESYFAKQNPIGRQVRAGDPGSQNTYTIVGLVPHVRYNRPNYPQRSFQAYFPYTQSNGRDQVLLLRTAGNPASLTTSVRKLVSSIDSTLPVTRIEPLSDAIAKIYAPQRISSYVICLFSGAALFLAAVGLYGVLAYSVAQRTREIGIRIAMGARSANILQLVLRQGLKLAGIGLVIGVTAALALARLMSSLLYGVSANDPLSLTIAILVLGAAAALASLLPALRAVRIEPITALRG